LGGEKDGAGERGDNGDLIYDLAGGLDPVITGVLVADVWAWQKMMKMIKPSCIWTENGLHEQ
jgi:hypothetical protein